MVSTGKYFMFLHQAGTKLTGQGPDWQICFGGLIERKVLPG